MTAAKIAASLSDNGACYKKRLTDACDAPSAHTPDAARSRDEEAGRCRVHNVMRNNN